MSSQWIKADIKTLVYLNKIVCYKAYLIIVLRNRIICHNPQFEEYLNTYVLNTKRYEDIDIEALYKGKR